MMKRGTLWPFPTPSKRDNISHIPTHTLSQAERPRPVNMQIKAPLVRVSGRHTEDMDSTAAGAAAPAKKTLCHFVQCWPLLTQLSRGERPWKCQGKSVTFCVQATPFLFPRAPSRVVANCGRHICRDQQEEECLAHLDIFCQEKLTTRSHENWPGSAATRVWWKSFWVIYLESAATWNRYKKMTQGEDSTNIYHGMSEQEGYEEIHWP